ncbi:hypothetical protein EDB81DRAFT_146215 [Dactylonectria macrodidyma]|uniref:BZIP domain-containing protein n=1 Tax=Dactylonectria macrodidyma TaxID=307937 RepID=A0A9P9INZ9_9HYPO|nr:hypothetical protein EDB81DRAFT_146215 [Dactylonectria macrodidyma]
MAAFVHAWPPRAGDFPFGQYFDGIQSTPTGGCLATPPPYRMGISAHTSRDAMVYHQAMNQVADASFFDEALGASLFQTEVGVGFPPPAPQYIMAPKMPDAHEPPRTVLPTVEHEQKPVVRSRNRRKSQATSSLSEASPPGPASEAPKPRKRGRKPKVEPAEPTRARRSRKEETDEEEETPKDPRRKRILERNRVAATKCRLRKRDEASALASQEQAMEDQNRYLSTCFDQLTAEIYHLKTQLLQHTDCNCVLIQKYIANEARKSVDGLMNSSSGLLLPDGHTPACHRGSIASGTSATDSFSVQTPDTEVAAPTWTDPFQQGSRSSEVRDDMFDMVLEPFQKEPPVSTQSNPNLSSLSGCDQGLFISLGSPAQPVAGMVWDSPWGLQ